MFPGISEAELRRRQRVVRGWIFDHPHMGTEVREYLNGGPVPHGYEAADKAIGKAEAK